MPDTSRRVTVTSPRTGAVRPSRVAVAREIDAQTGVGDAFMKSLIRSQLRLALLLLGVLAIYAGVGSVLEDRKRSKRVPGPEPQDLGSTSGDLP